jgi:FtsP/CotA-like multicopper oxidase with cupredoxin domain/fibronectin type 3 domain-containing protein
MFLPVDESLAGAGLTPAGDKYPQNRVAFHLHGGDSPWISDGTPHQWVTAVGDSSPYKAGNRFMNTPDMPFPGDGAQTIFWPNDQSSRLMWYHDHTFGLTRQNAYSGAAAGYVIIDAAELALQGGLAGTTASGTVNGQTINKAIPNGLLDQLVLVIQDKTWVPNDIATQDSKWDTKAWGQPGDLWYPHVYEPFELWGAKPKTDPRVDFATAPHNPAGRWDYAVSDATGLYLPPTVGLGALRTDPEYGDVAFPDGTHAGGPSATPESYMDTPTVNGVAYPVLHVEPKAYRVRFLNGANDRYWNLSLWKADNTVSSTDGRSNTEVKIIPFGAAGNTSNDPAGIPDPTTAGPAIIQFANEAGFLPKPVVHNKLMSFDITGTEIAGDFYLGGAERADTVIDFAQFAGQTLIMYNDSTAPVPGGDPRYDYYTNNPDQTQFGGAPTTLAGFGPNTRTVMQIVVGAAVTTAIDYPVTSTGAYDVAALTTNLGAAYKAVADAHIVTAMPVAADINTVANTITVNGKAEPLLIKTIRGFTDPNIGRLIAQIGIELPLGDPLGTPLGYVDAPTDIINAGDTQYWWIKNNDVDNHPMHFHLFNVQVVAHRVQADGSLRPPEPDEMGWKETVKNWPGEDVIVAMKPKTPALPFGLPNSVRLRDPTLAAGATANDVLYGTTVATAMRDGQPATLGSVPFAFTQFDLDPKSPNFGGLTPAAVLNTSADYGWEYVWHCHILGHEENDLMRPMVFRPVITASAAPSGVAVDATGNVTWTDPTPALDANGVPISATKGNSANEIGFRVERLMVNNNSTAIIGFTPLTGAAPLVDGRVNTLANADKFQDSVAALLPNTDYQYHVVAVNEAGEAVSNVATLMQAPVAPTSLAVAAAPAMTARALTLTWVDKSTNEDGFSVEASTDGGSTYTTLTTTAPSVASYAATVTPAQSYTFRVAATKTALAGYAPVYSTTTVTTPVELLAPVVTVLSSLVNGTPQALVTWTDTSSGESSYKLERCAGTTATCAATTANWLLLSTLSPSSSSYLDTTLATGATYVYRVRAMSGATAGPIGVSAQVATAIAVTAPSNLTASSPSGAGVTLVWTDNSTNETSFQVWRAPAGTGTFGATPLASVTRTTALRAATGGTATYADATALAGAGYDYKVVAVNTTGTTVSASLASNIASITLAMPTPSALTAIQSGANIAVKWTDTSATETAFEVLRMDTSPVPAGGVAPAPVTFIVARTAAQTTAVNGTVTYNDITAVPGIVYTYQVRAVNTPVVVAPAAAVPTYSSYTATVGATVVLPAPTLLTTALPLAPATGVILNWVDNATFETGYRVDRVVVTPDALGNVPAGTVYTTLVTVARTRTLTTSTGAVSYTDATAAALGAGQAYAYVVYALKATAVSASSNVALTVAAVAVTGAPTALTANTSSGNSIVLSWIDNTATETAYQVIRTDNTNPALPVVVTSNLSVVRGTGRSGAYTDVTAVVGKTYTYTVAAVVPVTVANPTGTLVSTPITAGLPLNAPTNATVSAAGVGITVGWTDASNNETGFQIVRNVAATDASGAPVLGATGMPTVATGSVPLTIAVTSTTTQKTAVGTARTYIDATALPGVTYFYTVMAKAGTTALPVVSTAVYTAPTTIKDTIAAPSAPTAVITNASRITVSWTDLSTNETGFLVERLVTPTVPVAGAAAPVWTTLATVARTGTASSGINTGVSYANNLVAPIVQGTYQYRVTAVSTSGVAPAVVTNAASVAVPSNVVDFSLPAAPTLLTATTTVGVAGVVNLSWTDNATNETGFTVQRATNATFTTGLVSTAVPGVNSGNPVNYTLNGLTTGTRYYFRVQATNAAGVSAFATVGTVAATGVAAPTLVTVP